MSKNDFISTKVQHFLVTADKDGEVALTTKLKYLEGRPVYEVPIQVLADKSKRPAIPQREQQYSSTFFWSKDMTRACVAVNYALAEALEKQETARYIGVADYSVGGIGQYEWEPKK